MIKEEDNPFNQNKNLLNAFLLEKSTAEMKVEKRKKLNLFLKF